MNADVNLERRINSRMFNRIRVDEGAAFKSKDDEFCDEDKKLTLKEVFLEVAKAYCTTTVLHGCKYLSEPKRTALERIVWFIILWSFVAMSLYLLWLTSQSSLEKPVIINLDTSYNPIWNYEFPALTLCPLNKLNKTLAENWVDNITIPAPLTREELLKILPNLLLLIKPSESENLETLQSVFDLNNTTAHHVYSNLSVKCENFLVACKFKSRQVPCRHLFRTIRTSEGYCCSFNYFGLRSSFGLNVYHVKSTETPTQPVVMRYSGRESGLTILLRTPEKDNFATLTASTGAKLLVHKPHNYPDTLTIEKMVQPGRAAFYSVYPEIIKAGPEIRPVPVEKRDCYFFNEKELFSLSGYSYKNCLFNCRNKFFIDLCGCIPFIYPAEAHLRICTLRDIPCLNGNQARLMALRMNVTIDLERKDEPAPCSCFPQCNDVVYKVGTSHGKMSTDLLSFRNFEFYEGVSNPSEYSEVTVFFKSVFATKYDRILYHNTYQILAAFGSLLGLFFGFSFVASFEFVYCFTLRIAFFIYVAKQKEKRESEEIKRSTSPLPTILGLYGRSFN